LEDRPAHAPGIFCRAYHRDDFRRKNGFERVLPRLLQNVMGGFGTL